MSNRPRPQQSGHKAHAAEDGETAQRAEHLAEPSWFHSSAHGEPREELVERYRQAWNRSERTPAPAPRPARAEPRPGAPYRDMVQSHSRPPARFLKELEFDARGQDNTPGDDDDAAAARPRRQIGLGVALALACGMAALSGLTVGLVNTGYPDLMDRARGLFGEAPAAVKQIPAAALSVPAAAPVTTVAKKPIATATLQVGDATGETNSLIPLDLHAEPADNGGDIFLKISGLPDTAYLTSGRRDGDKIWALNLDELKDVKLMVPQARQNQIDLSVAAFETKTGELAAPVKSMTVALSDVSVVPASAPPPSQTQTPTKGGLSGAPETIEPLAIPQPASATQGLTPAQEAALQSAAAGDRMLERGDLDGARHAYEEAWNGGAAAGAFGMARSFDPLVVRSLNIKDAAPDSGMAVAWYQRAASAGHAEAQDAIVRLKLKP